MGRVNLVLRSVFSDIFRSDVPTYTEFLIRWCQKDLQK